MGTASALFNDAASAVNAALVSQRRYTVVLWTPATLVPVTAAVIWGVFNVLDDPSRSGAAPVEVAGQVRLAIEFVVLGGGAAAITYAWCRDVGIAFALLVVFHYAASISRIDWLVR